jgi:hypothetical protein
MSSPFEVRLDFGADAQFLISTKIFNKHAEVMLQHINHSMFPKLTVRPLRVGVVSSTGQQFRSSLNPPLRKFMLDRASQIAAD